MPQLTEAEECKKVVWFSFYCDTHDDPSNAGHRFCIRHFLLILFSQTAFPIRVADVHLSTRTFTYSPFLCPSAGKTTTLFWDVRPERKSCDLFEKSSVRTSKTLPTSCFFDLAELGNHNQEFVRAEFPDRDGRTYLRVLFKFEQIHHRFAL